MKKHILSAFILQLMASFSIAHSMNTQFFNINGECETDNKIYSVSYERGLRDKMEDAFVVDLDGNAHQYAMFEIFDGHCGTKTVTYLQENLWNKVKEKLNGCAPSEYEQVIKSAFIEIGNEILAQKIYLDGSTALMALVIGNMLYVANVGDCRAVLCANNQAIQLSTDHRTYYAEEYNRITSLGGVIIAGRIGLLNISRCFGNYEISNFVNPMPSFFQKELTEDDRSLILASDGLWDVVNNQQAWTSIKNKTSLKDKSTALVRLAFENKTKDNVTAMVIDLQELRA
jgi:protein phosphatase 1L